MATCCPMSLSMLNFILGNLHQLRWPMYTQVMFRAMLARSFHGFLRSGEMIKSRNALKFKDIKLRSSSFMLHFRKFKHHRGELVKVKVKGMGAIQCPRVLMFEYLQLRGDYKGNLFCNADGSKVSYSAYSKLLRQVVEHFSLDPRLKPHSARSGAATNAAIMGVPEDRIKRYGSWASNAHQVYIQVPVLSL